MRGGARVLSGNPGHLALEADRRIFQDLWQKHGPAVDARPALGMLGQRALAALPQRKGRLEIPRLVHGNRQPERVHHGVAGALRKVWRHRMGRITQQRNTSRRPMLQPNGLELIPPGQGPVGLVPDPHEKVTQGRKGSGPGIRVDGGDASGSIARRAAEQYVKLGPRHRTKEHATAVGPCLDHHRPLLGIRRDLLRQPGNGDSRSAVPAPDALLEQAQRVAN